VVVAVGQVDLLVGGCRVVVPAAAAAATSTWGQYMRYGMCASWTGWLPTRWLQNDCTCSSSSSSSSIGSVAAKHLSQVKHGHAGQLVVAVGQVDLLVGCCRVTVPVAAASAAAAAATAMWGQYVACMPADGFRWAGWLLDHFACRNSSSSGSNTGRSRMRRPGGGCELGRPAGRWLQGLVGGW
jgi:hypothetical protein